MTHNAVLKIPIEQKEAISFLPELHRSELLLVKTSVLISFTFREVLFAKTSWVKTQNVISVFLKQLEKSLFQATFQDYNNFHSKSVVFQEGFCSFPSL